MLELNKLYHMDCMEAMKDIPDKYFELSIVDPPYGIGMDGGRIGGDNAGQCTRYDKKTWDVSPPSDEYFAQLKRVSINQIIFGANHFISRIPYDSPCWIIWDKDNTGNFADCELAWTSFSTAARKYTYRWNGMLQQNMKEKEMRIHPTQKPVALYEWLLKNYAKQGDKILDTHVGSASSLIACHNMGFDFMGFEIDADYHRMATERLEAVRAQMRLTDLIAETEQIKIKEQ